MTRTIDHIVATHKHASELRAQGKDIWPHQVNVRAIIQEKGDEGPANIADKSQRIAKLLRASLPAKFFDITNPNGDYDFCFMDALETLESYTEESLAEDDKSGIDIVEEFNGWLSEIYDWADRNRVWLGGPSAVRQDVERRFRADEQHHDQRSRPRSTGA